MKKIAFVASYGGHLSEVKRMVDQDFYAKNEIKIVFVTTLPTKNNSFYLKDFNRNNFLGGLWQFWPIVKYIKKQKIDLVITTGAAPGLYFGLIARLMGKKTIWVDSLANVDKISMSGKIATYFYHQVYVQWEHLSKGNIHYIGCLL